MKIKIVAPIFGFNHIKDVEFEQIDELFAKIENSELALTLIDPSAIREYSFEIPDYYKDLLEIDDISDISVYNIVLISSDIKKSRINFAAPIIINSKKKILVQVALDESKHPEFGLAESITEYL